MGDRLYYVYLLTNFHNTVIYTGVTNDLFRRVLEHRNGIGGVFSRRYELKKLVYYEIYGDVRDAIAREKQIKGGSRINKIKLINAVNPKWKDLLPEDE